MSLHIEWVEAASCQVTSRRMTDVLHLELSDGGGDVVRIVGTVEELVELIIRMLEAMVS